MTHWDVQQRIHEIGLLNVFYFKMIRSLDEFFPLIHMWRIEDKEFLVLGVILPLELHDIYSLEGLLICGIWEETHPFLVGHKTIELLASWNYGGSPNIINDGSLKISRIIDLTT